MCLREMRAKKKQPMHKEQETRETGGRSMLGTKARQRKAEHGCGRGVRRP